MLCLEYIQFQGCGCLDEYDMLVLGLQTNCLKGRCAKTCAIGQISKRDTIPDYLEVVPWLIMWLKGRLVTIMKMFVGNRI